MREDYRNGSAINCLQCGRTVRYGLLTIQDPPVPFFYSTKGKSILIRKTDEALAEKAMTAGVREPEDLQLVWLQILRSAPAAPDGGKFELWANIRCPHCDYEFPYNGGVRNPAVRIFDQKIVVVDGTTLVGDTAAESWILKVHKASSP